MWTKSLLSLGTMASLPPEALHMDCKLVNVWAKCLLFLSIMGALNPRWAASAL